MRHTQRQLEDLSVVSWTLKIRGVAKKSGGNRREAKRSAPRLFVHSISNFCSRTLSSHLSLCIYTFSSNLLQSSLPHMLLSFVVFSRSERL
jgi:hypothetical protein